MKSYYRILEIPETASAQDIKRAYFGMVKRFPPERFPEEFKDIREAYEVLADGERRAEYDRQGGLPEAVALILSRAKEHTRRGQHKLASGILNSAARTHSEYPILKEALAKSLEREGKNGLAMKIWEGLCKEFPSNANHMHELAQSYAGRGWHKKASEMFEAAVKADAGNGDIWTEYIYCLKEAGREREALEVCERAISSVSGAGKENLLLYALNVECRIEQDGEIAREYLLNMKRLMQGRSAGVKDEAAVMLALNGVMVSKNYMLFPQVQELANLLPRKGENLTKALGKAERICDIESLADKGYDMLFCDILHIRLNDCDCEDCAYNLMSMEYYLLDNLDSLRPQIIRLKKDFPHLYALHKDFLEDVLQTRNPESMLNTRHKLLRKYIRNDRSFTSSTETFQRESPKPGRNDPCPCGSGKKYKRCCGLND